MKKIVAVITPTTDLFQEWISDMDLKVYEDEDFIIFKKVSDLDSLKGVELFACVMGYQHDKVDENIKIVAKMRVR